MQKYGYKNISHRDDIKKNTDKLGKHIFTYDSGKYLDNYDFINWAKQSPCGVPGQTHYYIKTLDELLKANDIVSNTKN